MISFREIFRKSQLFVATCAGLLCAETFLINQTPVDFITVTIVFFATLFIYNASRLYVAVTSGGTKGNIRVVIEGNRMHLTICIIAFIICFILLTLCGFTQAAVFLLAAALSAGYMMPISLNGNRLKGLRNNTYLKNVTLAIIWSVITVVLPLSGEDGSLTKESSWFLMMRHFLFVFPLTVIYDLRDIQSDRSSGMDTIAGAFGLPVVRMISVISLSLFLVLVFTDTSLFATQKGWPVALALSLSALFAGWITLKVTPRQSPGYFSYVVDGAMIVQFVLVWLSVTVVI